MTYDLTGRVVAVDTLPLGDVLAQDALTGSSVLYVEDAADFDAKGGTLLLGGSQVVVYYSADDETGEVVLDEAADADYLAGDRVEIFDPSTNSKVVETVAQVEVEGTEQGGDPLEAIVDHALIPYLPVGIRDDSLSTAGTGEAVALEWRGDDLFVVNIIGREAIFDGTVIDPETLPPTDNTPTVPPISSPSLSIKGTADGLVVRTIETIDTTTVLDYHLTATPPLDPGTGEPLPFTPTSATKVGDATRSSVVLITELPDGTRLAPDTAYYLRVVASNVVGAAAPGPMAQGALDPSVVTDVVTGTLTAGFALLGGMQVGQITVDPDSGITIPNPTGVTVLPADGSAASFSGSVETDDLAVNGGLSINGETNFVNGALGLANVVVAPTKAPTLGQTWDYTAPIGTDTWSLTEGVNTAEWASVNTGTNTLKRFSKATGAQIASYAAPSGFKLWGVTALAGSFWAVAKKTASPYTLCLLKISSTGTKQAEWELVSGSYVSGIPGIGHNGSALLVGYATTTSNLAVRTISTAGTVTSTVTYDLTNLSTTPSSYVNGLGVSPFGRSGASVMWASIDGLLYTFDTTDLYPNEGFGAAESLKGVTWTSDGKLRYLGYSTYRVYEFAHAYWDAPVSVGYSWFDSDPTGGTHETESGPTASVQPWNLSLLRVQTPAPPDTGQPDDPDTVRVYLNGNRQAAVAPGVREVRYSAVTAGSAPPATNGFIGSSAFPGEVRSGRTDADGAIFTVRGDGTGRWGKAKVDTNGYLVVDQVGLPVDLSGSVLAATGWAVVSAKVVRFGPFIDLVMDFTRSGGTVVAGSGGNVSPDVQICTVPAAYRPTTYSAIGVVKRVAVQTGFAELDTSGRVFFTDGLPSITYADGVAYRVRFTFALGL